MSDNHSKMQESKVNACDYFWYIATIKVVNQWRTGLNVLFSHLLVVHQTSLSLLRACIQIPGGLKRQEILYRQNNPPLRRLMRKTILARSLNIHSIQSPAALFIYHYDRTTG